MFYRVRTITPEGLRHSGAELLAKAAAAGFVPDLIIGVRTGGYYLAEQMEDVLAHKVPLLPITCRRPGTAKKEKSGLFKRVLRHMPYLVTNPLRIAEHIYLTSGQKSKPRKEFNPPEEEVLALRAKLAELQAGLGRPVRILIADDAIDSGATLVAVKSLVEAEARLAAPAGADVRLAAVTVTTKAPLIEPDFLLYRMVLCRFSWSFDYHG